MKAILLGALGAALLAASANAAPIAPAATASTEAAGVEQVRLVCDEYGRCYRTRGPRYVQRYYGGDDGYVVRRSYGYYGGPGNNDRGYCHYGGGPSIGFSLGTRSW